jgi:hypothetical protein
MLDTWQVAEWLREGGGLDTAALLDRCELQFIYADTAFEIAGEREYDLYDVEVAAPRNVLSALEAQKPQIEAIEAAIRDCAQSINCYVRNIAWVPLLPISRKSPVNDELSAGLVSFEAGYILAFWRKALERKNSDPEGAITAARSLVESVCKHLLEEAGVEYPPNADLPKLYHLTVSFLALAPDQHSDRIMKRALGSAQAVVDSLASLRNYLGDAHGKSSSAARPDPIHAELAVNLAGAIATFLAAVWQRTQEQRRSSESG